MINQKNSRGFTGGQTFERRVTITLFSVFAMVLITGIYSYIRLNHIMDEVKDFIRPDRKIILIKEILNDISEAEHSVKTFSLTRDERQATAFYDLADETGQKVDDLKQLTKDDRTMQRYFDTLEVLVEEKFLILDRLMVIRDEFRAEQAVKKVMERITEQEQTQIREPGIIGDTITIQEDKKKDNFFRRLFSRKEKKDEEKPDTLVAEPAVRPEVSLEDLERTVEEVGFEVSSQEKGLREEELKLLAKSSAVMQRIRQLLSVMEEKEELALMERSQMAGHKAEEVRRIMIIFGLAAASLILLSAIAIYRYVRKNNEYNAVLQQARQDAEDLARAKQMFLANMSHEIRTPMNIISGFLEQVDQGKLEPDQRDRINIIRKSSEHLLRLLNDLLDLSRLQAHKMELATTRFSLPALLDDLQMSLEPAAAEKNLALLISADPSIPVEITGDPVRIRQILLNLTSNAIKFTNTGSVSVRADLREETADSYRILFEVADTGPGIEKHDLVNLFDSFKKGSASNNPAEGAGLGLAITHRLVELHGGIISVESEPGAGSVFRVEIPFQKVSTVNDQEVSRVVIRAGDLDNLAVLVVDDEEYNRRLVKIILEKYGAHVFEAGTADEAISWVQRRSFDLVLMDIRLPGMPGTEAAARITSITGAKGISMPIIAMTAGIASEETEKSRKSGMADIILKPFTENTLLQIISKHSPAETGPVYDLTPLRDSCSGNEPFFREMVSLFLRDTESGLDEIDRLLKTNNLESAAELVHKISAPCGHLKAKRLHALLKELQAAATQPESHRQTTEILWDARNEFGRIKKDMEKSVFNKNDLT